jgi:hypothetical protein
MNEKWHVQALGEERQWRLPPLLQRIFDTFHAAAVEAGRDQKTADSIAGRAVADQRVVKRWISVYAKALEDGVSSDEASALAYAAAASVFSAPRRDARGDPDDADALAAEKARKEKSMTPLEKFYASLELSAHPSRTQIHEAVDRLIDEYEGASNPRQKLTELAAKLARERNLEFPAALTEVVRMNPTLYDEALRTY